MIHGKAQFHWSAADHAIHSFANYAQNLLVDLPHPELSFSPSLAYSPKYLEKLLVKGNHHSMFLDTKRKDSLEKMWCGLGYFQLFVMNQSMWNIFPFVVFNTLWTIHYFYWRGGVVEYGGESWLFLMSWKGGHNFLMSWKGGHHFFFVLLFSKHFFCAQPSFSQ